MNLKIVAGNCLPSFGDARLGDSTLAASWLDNAVVRTAPLALVNERTTRVAGRNRESSS